MAPPRPDAVLRPSLASTPIYRTNYVPDRPGLVKLNHNEADADVAPEVKEAIFERLRRAPWHRYPDPFHTELRQAISAATGHPADGVLVTNGGNDAIARLMQALHPEGVVVTCPPSYYLYDRCTAWLGLRHERATLRPGTYEVDAHDVIAAAQGAGGRALFLHPSPNNPTGNVLPGTTVDRLLRGFPGLVCVDEAYFDFSGVTVVDRIAQHDHLLVLRTFSKAFGVAGVRLGYLLGDPAWIAAVDKVTTPYSVDLFSQVAGVVLLEHAALRDARVTAVRQERARLRAALDALHGLRTEPSESNFFLVHLDPALGGPSNLVQALKARDVVLRDASAMPLLSDCFRVTVGEPADNDRVIEAVTAWVTAAR